MIKKNRNIIFLLIISLASLAMVTLQGCASVQKASNTHYYGASSLPAPTPSEPKEAAGPPEPYGAPPVEESIQPEKPQVKPLVLVLGPGLAPGFAHVGVIRGLIEAKIPIGAIYGTEIGSLVASLYGVSSNLNQFEWGLQRFKPEVFQESSGFFTKKNWPSDGSKVEEQLRRVFGKKEIQNSKLPLRIAIQSQRTGSLLVLNHGNLVEAIRCSIAVPGVFSAGAWTENGSTLPATSAWAPKSLPELLHDARSTGIGPVVLVDLSDGKSSQIREDDLKEADYILKLNVAGIGNLDFQKKTEAAFRGKNNVKSHLAEIRQVAGMSEEGSLRSETRSVHP